MIKPKYKDIATEIEKSEQTIRGYKINNPKLLELLKLGMFYKMNNLTHERLQKMIQLQEVMQK